ncbi:DUF58 domain-containing protein [Paenibacillus sp. NFR01]|uniref:DUF58 domain-containing protein n=1 Tax=Paenibacillus sp. NFR01 TaxID=1566279 RepID=UPI0008B1C767|nr:DUF58 domain-containing protein [Paenibacillus sp. NFR01]SET90147.1 Uncharacterized conserved protein, DUF58 family, contains vWF domain [Paenibacillus sp. NFR01]
MGGQGFRASAGIRIRKFAGVIFIWAVTLFFLLFQGGKSAFMLFIMISVLFLYLIIGGLGGVQRAKGKRSLFAEQDKPELLHAGGSLRVKLEISIPGFLPLPYVVVKELLKRHNGESWIFQESIIPGLGKGELIFQTPPLERGRYTFEKTEIASEDIFGLVEHNGSFLAEGQFRVLPRAVFIPRWQLYERRARIAGPQAALLHSRRETTQINGVRDYVYGDRLTRIHWNATAKTGDWKSKEFEHESLPKTMVVLDGSSLGYSGAAQFELAVSIAASLLGYGIRERIGIGLCCLDKNTKVFQPADNAAERQRMTQYLIDINAEGRGPLVSRLEKARRMFPKGAYLVLISPQTGRPVVDVMRWAEAEGMTPSQIHVRGNSAKGREGEWLNVLRSHGVSVTSVGSLQDLPAILGGEAP